MAHLASGACDAARRNIDECTKKGSFVAHDIILNIPLTKYEVTVFIDKLRSKLEEKGITVAASSDRPVSKTKLSTEEFCLMNSKIHYTYHANICKAKPCVWLFMKMTNEGKKFLKQHRHQSVLTAHLKLPMATDTNNVEENQRVYVNIGYRGDPIPAPVVVQDTCVCLGQTRQNRKMFYRFKHVSTTMPTHGNFLNYFFVPVSQKTAGYLATEPIHSEHSMHTTSRRRHYTEAGVAALKSGENDGQ